MMKIKNVLLICLVVTCGVIFLPHENLAGGKFSNPKSIAMGGAYIGLVRGADAPSWNPANFGLSTKNRNSFNLLNVGVGLYNNSFTLSQFTRYNGDSLSTDDINNILNSITKGGLKFIANAESQLLGFATGQLAFSIEALFYSNLQLDKNFFEVMLRGNEMDRVYHFENSQGKAFGVISYSLSAVGFGLKFAPFTFDFGISNGGGMFPGNQRGFNLAAGMGLWF